MLLLIAFVLQGTTSVLAGTTGAINGSVVDPQSNQPIAGARVTAASPSQSATTTTDATGRFSFLSLAPDTYTVSVPATAARDAVSVNGITVQADATVGVTLQQPTKLRVIGTVTSRAAGALVKPGTTADVYSINAVAQDKASLSGGGGTLNSAFSAIATVPGVYVAANQNGYIGASPTLSIRGGDYDQIGYELDGVPVNRAFDNYPSGPASSLGQQELQVYTGAPAANAEANGISGYINQVIRTGTAPATRNLTLGIGTPTMYNKISFEAGGANPSRTFSYYIGAGAYNQDFRYYDQYNGASLQHDWGAPLIGCTAGLPQSEVPSCYTPSGVPYTNNSYLPSYVLGNYAINSVAEVQDRDTVANFHFGLPRKDGNRDDIQLLFDNNFINNLAYNSTNDQGGATFLNDIGFGVPSYLDAYQSSLPRGVLLPVSYNGGGSFLYPFPQSPTGRATGANCDITHQGILNGCIEPDRRDAFVNNQGIGKVQYQRNFGTNAFLRVYGYTYYSDWLQTGPQSTQQNYLGFVPSDYELHSHTRGVSAQFTDQINSQHLLSIQGSYTTSNTLRDNNQEEINGAYGPNTRNRYTVEGILVDSSNPTNGICYSQTAVAGAHTAVNCYNGSGSNLNKNNSGYFTLQQALTVGGVTPASGICGGGPCQYLTTSGGLYATYNTVTPKFYAASITDQWKPTDRLNINLGLRLDSFTFQGSDTNNDGLARQFYYAAWNREFPTLQQFNVSAQSHTYTIWEPRLGLTYTVDPRTVLRASYGRYGEAPNSAFTQYNFLQASAPINLKGFVITGIGNTPGHMDVIKPSIANSYDFSYEHQFKGDTSVKVTPFLRKTQDQIQQFYLDQKTNFVSGVNVGAQTSQGLEFELDKGDFSRNGLAARATFTYTNSYINYKRLAKSGVGVIDGFNSAISTYNGFTKAGGGAPCYTTAGAADNACAAGSVANPYYNAPIQPLMDPNGKYATYDTFPGGIGAGGYSAYGAPYVAGLILQYKHGPLAITPSLGFSGGVKYGVPLSTPGIDPSNGGAGCTGLAGSTVGDPRYPYGAAGGAPYDASTCGASIVIPNPYTGRFDNVGAFTGPNALQLHTQITYDINKRVTLVGNFANIVTRCWGGTHTKFTVNHACGYTATYGAGSGPVPAGNAYNPGDQIQPFLATPYDPTFPGFPFNMYFEARIKI